MEWHDWNMVQSGDSLTGVPQGCILSPVLFALAIVWTLACSGQTAVDSVI